MFFRIGSHKIKVSRLLSMFFLICSLLLTLFPIYWMLTTSFKQQSEVYQMNPTLFPKEFTLKGYGDLFSKSSYLSGLKNSLIVAGTVAAGTIALAFPCSYAISKMRFRGKRILSRSVLFTYLIPASVLYIPMYMILTQLQLSNSLAGLMLIYPTMTIPYAIWILVPYVGTIPVEMEEAAHVDGCTRIQSMLRIVLPLALPGITTTFVFSFTMCWGEFLYALVSMTNEGKKTMPLIISGLIWGDLYPWPQIMAGGIIACAPIILIYMFASKMLINGLTAGGVKM